MSKANTQSSIKYLGNQSKNNNYLGQLERTYKSFCEKPKTVLMVLLETKIYIKNQSINFLI